MILMQTKTKSLGATISTELTVLYLPDLTGRKGKGEKKILFDVWNLFLNFEIDLFASSCLVILPTTLDGQQV